MVARGDEHANKNNRKGFTLAELLIVVAIIAVLVAISIPIFHAQLRKARLATNQANGRAAFSAAEAAYLDYVAEHGSINANKGSSNAYNTVTYSYFPTAGKGILNMSVNGWWIVDDNDHNHAIYTNTDVSSWTVDTQVSGDLKIGDRLLKSGRFIWIQTPEQ
ncbi:MAG: prepilin-type N-terminal cleavage/methylation domain-containing protein [Bilifractor sp.]|nr:prepilin-type N-terminal cleavage/methylation domain-containing protein [Lachnospiraceae bacterium]MDY2836647.1 prepilin-type N-terminal cleavage/methylation domain-containing protein [Bilifractor sp.]